VAGILPAPGRGGNISAASSFVPSDREAPLTTPRDRTPAEPGRAGMPRREFLLAGGGALAGALALAVPGLVRSRGGRPAPTAGDAPAAALPGVAEAPAPVRQLPERVFRPEDQRGWNARDAAPAIEAAILAARRASATGRVRGVVEFRRGGLYPFRSLDVNRNDTPEQACTGAGITLRAAGAGDALPVLATPDVGRSAFIQSFDRFENLHLSGPFTYPRFRARREADDVQPGDGINGSMRTGWAVAGCIIEGFGTHGVLCATDGISVWCNAESRGVLVEGCVIRHNGAGGVQLMNACYACRVAGNHIHDNAQNGIDVNGSENLIEGNTVHGNGWGSAPWDRNGILVWGRDVAPARDNLIRHNRCHGNRRHGVQIAGTNEPAASFVECNRVWENECFDNAASGIEVAGHPRRAAHNRGTDVFGNVCYGNGEWGIAFTGLLRNVSVHWNRLRQPNCLARREYAGVTFASNSCE
jgi:parallel beta-helix repeat protein